MNSELQEEIEHLKKRASHFTILYIEDEEDIRVKTAAFLKKIFDRVDTASNGEDGLNKYRLSHYDIIITDIKMPIMNGIEFIRTIRSANEHQEIIVISAHADPEYLTESIQLAVSGYIIKPVNFNQIIRTLEQTIYKLSLYYENEMYKTRLESMVEERTEKILHLQQQLSDNYQQTIRSLIKMIEGRDTYTGGHSERVAAYSKSIAEAMGMTPQECDLIYQAGILHDVGKIITPDAILLKPGKLNDIEYALIQDHVKTGYTLLGHIPMYKEVAEIIYAHHEHYDGSGYPRGLRGEEIPLFARIMIVADAFDAMTTSRIYKARKTIPEALEELKEFSNIWYDAAIVEKAVTVLASVQIENLLKQEPRSQMDDERFAYFYKDSLTNLYNHFYLDFILQKNQEQPKFQCFNLLYIKNFTSFNQQYGWSEGDIWLREFADYLQSEFSDFIIFRIFGDDFALLHSRHRDIDIDKINQIPLLKTHHLTCEHKHIDVENGEIKSYKDL